MDQYLASIKELASKKRLFPAEQIITSLLYEFEATINNNLKESDIETIEAALLNLLNINDGKLSLQCSVRIANCLLVIYQITSPPKVWNLFTKCNQNPNSAIIYTTGHIINQIGSSIQSNIPGFLKMCLTLEGDLMMPALFAMTPCFKRNRKDTKQFAKNAFYYGKTAVKTYQEVNQLLGLRLIRVIIKFKVISIKSILRVVDAVIDQKETAFVNDECCNIISKCAFYYYIFNDKVKEGEENNINKDDKDVEENNLTKQFENVFQIFSNYKKHFPQILRHLLDMLDPFLIYSNLPTIFMHIRKINSAELSQLISLFGTDVKNDLFQQVVKESPPSSNQLQVLQILQSGEESQKEIAALALQLTQNESSALRATGSQWFSELAKTNPSHAKLYLETAVLYLMCPPEDNPNLQTDIRAFGSIATHILGGSINRDELANGVANSITQFLERSLTEFDVYDPSFSAAFSIMTVLPSYLVPSTLAEAAISVFTEYPYSHTNISEINWQRLKLVAQAIALFLASNSGFSCFLKFFKMIYDFPYLQTQTTMLTLLIEAPRNIPGSLKLNDMLISVMNPIFLKVELQPTDIISLIKSPMTFPDEIINSAQYTKPKFSTIYSKLSPSLYGLRVIAEYGKYVQSMQKSMIPTIVNSLLQNGSGSLISHALILAICQNDETRKFLPKSFYSQMLNTMTSYYKNYHRIQITAECLSIFATEFPTYLSNIIQKSNNLPDITKCLLYASLFANVNISIQALSNMINELSSLTQNELVTPYALHALSIFFKIHSVDMSLLKISDIQCQVLLKLLNLPFILKPYNLYYASQCFTCLLPVISPEIVENKSNIVSLIRLIVQGFDQIRIPYSRQIFFTTMRSVFALANGIVKISKFRFPSSRGASMPLLLSACAAFTDNINMNAIETKEEYEDLFRFIPKILFALQKTNDKRAYLFITVIGEYFAKHVPDPNNEKVRERITDWMKIISSVLANNVLPETGIEPAPIVKQCCLITSKPIIDLLSKSEPLMTEILDDAITSVTRAIEIGSKLLTKDAYDLLTMIISKFEKSLAPEGSRLLLLYDSQFSIAVRTGFLCNLEYTGQFLNIYLHFHLEDLKTNPEEFENVLNSYVKGLKACSQRTFTYFEVAAHIICLARDNISIFEMIKEFSKSLITHFCEIVNISMALWRTNPPDWKQISLFRFNYSSFYREIVVAFIWLQEIFNDEYINFNEIIQFEIEELNVCTESWRIAAAFDALNTAFLVSPQKLSQNQIDITIETVNKTNKRFPNLIGENLPKFLQICKLISSAPEGKITGEQLTALAENTKFDTKATAEMIKNTDITQILSQLNDRIFSEFISNQLNINEFLALSTLLFENAPNSQQYFLSQFFDRFNSSSYQQVDDQDKVTYLTRILRRSSYEDFHAFEDQICKFVWSRFKVGGMFLISTMLIESPNIGLKMFLFKDLIIFSALIDTDILNALVYIQFMTMGISIAIDHKNELEESYFQTIIETASRITFNAVSKWGIDLRGEDIISYGAYFIRLLSEVSPTSVKSAFDSCGKRNCRLIVQFTENEIKKLEAKNAIKNLKTFSHNTRRVQNDSDDDDWQTLEIDDSF